MATLTAKASLHKNKVTTMGRISGYISKTNLFKDVNLASQIYGEGHPVTRLTKWSLPGGSGAWKNYKFQDIILQPYFPTKIGDRFGPTWSTHWFKVEIDIPITWVGKEVHLRWSSSSEATIWDQRGFILQGISPGYREEYILTQSWDNSGKIILFVEMACNSMFGGGDDVFNSDIAPPPPNKFYTLQMCQIQVFNRDIFKSVVAIEMLYGMANNLGEDHKGYQAMYAANEMINLIENEEHEKATQIAEAFFAEETGKKVHTLYAMGHCHIDTAWLWTYDETIRKCARAFSAQIALMKEYPEHIFTCSTAQQYAWMKQWYPDLYSEMKQFIAAGRFIPVGGCWIEMDGNVPNGEAFIRQFFYGQQYFQKEFGITCKEFWLPDTFGYSAQIPQMMKHVGIDKMLTQKMSWNLVNKFPHHNFWWEGIDGTQVLVHFPPGDSYNMTFATQELLFSRNNAEDKGRSNNGIYLYGHGDGGGGPIRTMLERFRIINNVDGMPKVKMATPTEFFDVLEQDQKKLCKWAGELYLELHNGTYTSQAKIKWYNRKGEFFFREVELLLAMAYVQKKVGSAKLAADMERVDACWKDFLLNQFHDVLPGSCIEMVATDAWDLYEKLFAVLYSVRSEYNEILLGQGKTNNILYNPLSWDVKMVVFNKRNDGSSLTLPNVQKVTLDSQPIEESPEGRYRVPNAFDAALVTMSPSGYSLMSPLVPSNPVVRSPRQGLSNGIIRIDPSPFGAPYEDLYFTGKSGIEQEVFNDRLNTGIRGGMIYMYDDVPLFWDAWDVMDYHMETRRLPDFHEELGQFEQIAEGPIVGAYRWRGTFGNGSSLTRYTILRADSPMIEYYLIVDWKESHKMLKVEFPVDILSNDATYEIQYGHAKRPTHMNTSWDMAKFEVCGHKWMDISQADKGVTVITDSKYGWNCRDNIIRLSLLKSPKNPDANCDIHKHFIYYAVLPHEGTYQEAEVVKRAYELNYFGSNNVPLLYSDLSQVELPTNWVQTDHPAIIVEAFKAAHDLSNAVCIRLYESQGGSAKTKVSLGFNLTKVQVCNGMEIPTSDPPLIVTNNSFETSFHPFEIKSFLINF